MKKTDLVYKDSVYEIYKKHAGDVGDFQPITCFDLIDIAIHGLKDWENGGLAYVRDYEKIIEKICKKLRATIKE